VEEAAFLLAVHGIVSRVEIQHDLGRRRRVVLDEELDQQSIDRGLIDGDLRVALRLGDGGTQPSRFRVLWPASDAAKSSASASTAKRGS
jgi:hypothetical protein